MKKKKKQTQQIKLSLPRLMPTPTMKEYLSKLPEGQRTKLITEGDNLELAKVAGVDKRIGYLLAAYYHIHSIQTLIQADIEILLDDWNLWLKGIRPAFTSIQQSDDKFYRAMSDLFKASLVTDEYYAHDVDSLYTKFMRWESIPKTWKPNQDQRIQAIKSGDKSDEETLVVEDKYEIFRVGAMNVPATERTPFGNKDVYCVAEMGNDETVNVNDKTYRTISSARKAVTLMSKAARGKSYIIYKRSDYWHYRPIECKMNKEE